VKQNSLKTGCYKPNELCCYGYSEIVRYFEGTYKEAKISKDSKQKQIGYPLDSTVVCTALRKKYKLDPTIRLYPVFYETVEIFAQFPDLGKKNTRWLFLNDVYGMSALASKVVKRLNKRKKFDVVLTYVDTIQLKIIEELDKLSTTYLSPIDQVSSDEIYEKSCIAQINNKDPKHGYDLILIQNYLSAQVDASDEYNSMMSFLSKVNSMIGLQAKGGSCVLKINSIYLNLTVKIIKFISICYDEVFLHKCTYTQTLVDENYLILRGFRFSFNDNNKDEVMTNIQDLITRIQNMSKKEKILDLFERIEIDEETKQKLFCFNTKTNEDKIQSMINTIRFDANKESCILDEDMITKKLETKLYLEKLK